MTTRLNVPATPDAGFRAWLHAAARLRRARALYAYGQSVAARGDQLSSRRAARLYRRALQVLGAAAELPRVPDRVVARDRLRAQLAQRGISGFLRAHARQVTATALGVVVLAAVGLVAGWLEPDLAEGKPWVASTAWASFPASGVMSGEAPIDGRFHTQEEASPWVQIDLGHPQTVHAVRVENRTNCCRERALPLVVELSADGSSWKRVGYRRILFDTFTQSFTSQEARYVRLRVDRRSSLHLRRISVF